MEEEMAFDWRTIDWHEGRVRLIDQTRLPDAVEWLELGTVEEVARAIETMQVRPPPPTAVNLFWALERMEGVAESFREFRVRTPEPSSRAALEAMKGRLLEEARRVLAEDVAANRQMGRFGAGLLPDGSRVLTHCNAGALATVGYGTALGVIRAAVEAGKRIEVFADETRPRLQGMKLTAWELHRDGIPVTLITDNMAGSLMRQGKIDCALVGADRIAANGDVANKIGTYPVAVLCREHRLPFYVAAPLSTLDWTLESGDQIPIEARDSAEVTHLGPHRIAPDGVEALNPAFDITPARLVTALITERGVLHHPCRETLQRWKNEGGVRVQGVE